LFAGYLDHQTNYMADNLKDRGPQDRSRISMSEDWEIDYWTKELNCSEEELRDAISKAGSSVESVREFLRR